MLQFLWHLVWLKVVALIICALKVVIALKPKSGSLTERIVNVAHLLPEKYRLIDKVMYKHTGLNVKLNLHCYIYKHIELTVKINLYCYTTVKEIIT